MRIPLECELWTPAPQHFQPCDIPAPLEDGLALETAGTYVLDTTAGTLAPPGGGTAMDLAAFTQELAQADGPVLLLSVRAFAVGSATTVRVVGSRPLLVASWSTMTIAGTVDAGSRLRVTDPGGAQAIVTAIERGAGSA
ncbi:MAG: hypothetical protein KIT31_28600, partial [Deltaproteobacteria bacterium]|nr:hypothetical protein [Deltaproteobacteria bacterium]